MKKVIFIVLIILAFFFFAKTLKAKAPERTIDEYTPRELIHLYGEQYGVSVRVLEAVARCESQIGKNTNGDGGNAQGIYQYWEGTWSDFEKIMGEDLDKSSTHDQIKMTAWAFSKGYGSHWTSYRAIKNGGVYEFYSKKLGRDFKIICEL